MQFSTGKRDVHIVIKEEKTKKGKDIKKYKIKFLSWFFPFQSEYQHL